MTIAKKKITLAHLSRHLYRKGWMEGTGGNLSIRREGRILITPSGVHKGRIREEDILELDGEGRPFETETRKPSAETAIHRALYNLFPEAGAVIHVHTPDAIVASLRGTDHLWLPPLEVLKGLGCPLPEEAPPIPIFENDPSVDRIAERIENRLRETPVLLPVLLIRHHGTTVWGNTLDDALRHIELAEFCFRVMLSLPHSPSPAHET